MTLESLAQLLESTGLPVAYSAFPEGAAPALPYICYLATGTNNFAADGEAYFVIQDVNVELYTAIKSPQAEAIVEAALSGLFWDKSETYIDSERCYQILYEIEV